MAIDSSVQFNKNAGMFQQEAFIIGSQILTNIKLLSIFGPDKQEKILKRVSPDTLNAIKKATKTIYVPLAYDIELTEAVQAEVHDEGLIQWSKEAFYQSLGGTLLGPMLKGMIRLFNLGPPSLVKFSPRAWQQIYKNGGEMTTTKIEDNIIEFNIRNMPLLMLRSPAYILGVIASFQAVLDVTKTKGTVKMKSFSLDTGDTFWEILWEKTKR